MVTSSGGDARRTRCYRDLARTLLATHHLAKRKISEPVQSQLSRIASRNPRAPSPSWKLTETKRLTIQPGASTIHPSAVTLNAASTNAPLVSALNTTSANSWRICLEANCFSRGTSAYGLLGKHLFALFCIPLFLTHGCWQSQI